MKLLARIRLAIHYPIHFGSEHRDTFLTRGNSIVYQTRLMAQAEKKAGGVMQLLPMTLKAAFAFIALNHRHHKPPQGGLFAIGLTEGETVIGCVVIGRPVSRMLADGYTAEVTRLATDGSKNACSMLYGAAWRACRAIGYRRLVTYILDSEPGTSLEAAGWKLIGQAGGGSWSRLSREREDNHPVQMKLRYERVA